MAKKSINQLLALVPRGRVPNKRTKQTAEYSELRNSLAIIRRAQNMIRAAGISVSLVEISRAPKKKKSRPRSYKKAGVKSVAQQVTPSPAMKTKDERRRRAGLKAARVRGERLEKAAQEIPETLHDVWQQVRHRLKTPRGRRTAEVFMEWVHDHPAEVATLRAERSQAWDRALSKLQRHCTGAVNRAKTELKRQKFDTFATLTDKTKDRLNDCSRNLGDDYDPNHVERSIRLTETGAPF